MRGSGLGRAIAAAAAPRNSPGLGRGAGARGAPPPVGAPEGATEGWAPIALSRLPPLRCSSLAGGGSTAGGAQVSGAWPGDFFANRPAELFRGLLLLLCERCTCAPPLSLPEWGKLPGIPKPGESLAPVLSPLENRGFFLPVSRPWPLVSWAPARRGRASARAPPVPLPHPSAWWLRRSGRRQPRSVPARRCAPAAGWRSRGRG
jgi:hypothetical protein